MKRGLDMAKRLLIWGASGHAQVVADIVNLNGAYDLVGFFDDITPLRSGQTLYGLPIFNRPEQLDELLRDGVGELIVGIGDCQARLMLAEVSREKGFHLPTAVHPGAIVAADAKIGAGSVVVAGAVVNPGARIGENVIINTCASVDHECDLEDGVHVSPGAHLAGRVVVGRAAWIGIGAVVADRVHIGAGAMIGAGAVVINDIPDHVVAYGVPAKVIRKRMSNES